MSAWDVAGAIGWTICAIIAWCLAAELQKSRPIDWRVGMFIAGLAFAAAIGLDAFCVARLFGLPA